MLRLFLALELSGQQKHSLHDLQGRLRSNLNGVRWVHPENMHLTIKYLGETNEDVLEDLKSGIKNVVNTIEPFTISYGKCGVFPSPQKARVIWVGLNEGHEETLKLHEKVESAVVSLGLPPEERAYSPHLTLGRVRYQLSPAAVEATLAENIYFKTGSAVTDGLYLFQSHLTKQGASYVPLFKATFNVSKGC